MVQELRGLHGSVSQICHKLCSAIPDLNVLHAHVAWSARIGFPISVTTFVQNSSIVWVKMLNHPIAKKWGEHSQVFEPIAVRSRHRGLKHCKHPWQRIFRHRIEDFSCLWGGVVGSWKS